MTKARKIRYIVLIIILSLLLLAGICIICILNLDFGFDRSVSAEEQTLRMRLVQQAESWLGRKESDGTHKAIIDIYNRHEPLAQGYAVQYTDSWCAALVSAAAIECGLTEIIPTECGCERQIQLFQDLGRWVETDSYTPLPGDIIYYCWRDSLPGDCTGWSDHVGIVAGTAGGFIKVIEGNFGAAVRCRYIPIDSPGIRGFAVPDYASLI